VDKKTRSDVQGQRDPRRQEQGGGKPPSSGPGTRGTREILPIIAVLAVALIARLIALLSLRGDIATRVPLLDSAYYMQTAQALARGEGWPAGPHFMSPIYPFLLSGLFRVLPPTVESVQWTQLGIGLATTTIVYLSARRFSRDAGLFAAFLYALCGPAIAYENQVLLEALLAFALAGFSWLIGAPRGGATRRSLIIAGATGVAVGIAAAGRPTYALLLPAALLMIGRGALTTGPSRFDSRRILMVEMAACLVGFVLITAPPSIRNIRETGRSSFVTTSGGLNLYIGNYPGASGTYSQPPGIFLERDPSGTRSASRMAGKTLTPDEASRYYAGLARQFVRSHPGRALRLAIRKAGYFISPDEIPQIESFDSMRDNHVAFRFSGPITWSILFPLALLGAIRRPRRDRTSFAAVLVVAAGLLTHVIFFSTGRYRAAILPAMTVLAGAGGIAIRDSLRARRPAATRTLWPIAAAILLLAVAPRYNRRASEAWGKHQAAIRYEQIGANRTAEQLYLQALAIDSTLGESWHNLAACEVKEGRSADAIQNYKTALRWLGENPITLYNIAILYGGLGMDERALEYFDRSIAADPADADVRVDRGIALYRLGRKQEAYGDWRRVREAFPGNAALTRTIGRLATAGATDIPPDLMRFSPDNGSR
jgi:tetratricopeptide (TPR) repeat protein